MRSLSNHSVLITGAGTGIGKTCALRFAEEGADILIADVDMTAAEAAVEEIRAAGHKAFAVEMDVTSEEQVEAGVQHCVEVFGGIDILVANAGIQIVHPFDEYPFEDWKRLTSIHGDGSFLTARAAFREMKRSGHGGKIIFMGSVHSHEASVLKSAYCYAKHGLLGLSRVVAKEGAPHGIGSYLICPGFVKTKLVEKQIPEQAQALGISEDQVIKEVMLKDTIDGAFTTMDEVVDSIIHVAYDRGALSGQSFIVSHGWNMK